MRKPAWLIVAMVVAVIGATVWLLAGGGTKPGGSGPGDDPGRAKDGSEPSEGIAGPGAEGVRDGRAEAIAPAGFRKPSSRPASGESMVTGRVIDEATRSGIARARLVLRHPRGEFAVEAETGADGRFALERVPGVLGARLFVAAGGFGPRLIRDVNVPPHDKIDLGAIVLQKGFPIAGRVLAASGGPIAGAQVDLVESASSKPGVSQDLVQIFRDLREDDEALDQAATAADGTFAFPAAAPGSYVLIGRKPGWQVRITPPLVVGDGDAPPFLELRLSDARRLQGTVTDEATGDPIAGAEVAALEVDLDFVIFPRSQKTVTGADGRFSYSSFGNGQIALVVQAAGYSGATLGNLVAGGKDVEIKLKKGARIEGRVFDKVTAKGLPGATVVAFRLDLEVALEETRSGPDGAYAMACGPAGSGVAVFAKLDGYTMADVFDAMMSDDQDAGDKLLKPDSTFPEGGLLRRDLPMMAGGSLSGRVVDDATGQGIADAQITARPRVGVDVIAFADPVMTRSRSDGTFTIAPIGAGRFAVTAHADGYVPPKPPPGFHELDVAGPDRALVEIPPGGAAADVALRLMRGSELTVLVTDPDGNPLPGASVTWMIPDERLTQLFGEVMQPRSVATDAAGSARLTALPALEEVILAARHAEYPAGGHVKVSTAPLPGKPPVIAVVRAATLAGVVIGPDGHPARNRDVNVSTENGEVARAFGQWAWMLRRASTDGAGRFLIENLPPGRASIRIGETIPSKNRDEDAAGDEVLDPSQASIELTAGRREDVTLRLIRTQSITGKILDASGRPLANVMLHAFAAGQTALGDFWASSEEDGTFRLEGMPPGTYKVDAVRNTESGAQTLSRTADAGSSGVDFRFGG